MKIDIKEITKKRTVTREDGEKIQIILNEAWDKEEQFIIDFDNVLVASVSFLDEAFGQLALCHTKETLQKKLKFENIVDYDKALLNDILYSRFRQRELGEDGPSIHKSMHGKHKKVAV
jgi:hypothetical protein